MGIVNVSIHKILPHPTPKAWGHLQMSEQEDWKQQKIGSLLCDGVS